MNKQLDIGKKIRFFRELKGFSQEYVAFKLGISQQAYQKIESGVTKLNIERAEFIAKHLGIDLNYLLNFNPNCFNCTHLGNGITNNTTVPQELINQHNQQIETLKYEISFLRDLIKDKMSG